MNTTTIRRLASASLSEPVSDPENRSIMHMSTLIATDLWLLETAWDGMSIGDIQIYINKACGHNGARMTHPSDTEFLPNGKPKEVPVPDQWVWWRGVPKSKVSHYSFVEWDLPTPATLVSEDPPFQIPRNAERQAKPIEAGKGGAAAT